MRDELKIYEQIDRYLKNELSGNELSDFEDKMKTDASFYEEVNNNRLIHELVIDHGLLDLKRKMQAIDSRHHPSPFKKFGWHIGVTLLLATLTIVVVKFGWKNDQEENQKEVVAKTELVLPEVPKLDSGRTNNPIDKSAQRVNEIKELQKTHVIPNNVLAEKGEKVKPVEDSTKVSLETRTSEKVAPIEDLREKQQEKPATLVCHLDNSSIQVSTTESCNASPTGKITIDSTSFFSGQRPFEFSFDNKKYYSKYVFDNLYAGIYYLHVKDALGCTWTDNKEIIVREKDCRTYEYSFYPDKGEVWMFPLETSSNGKIAVYSRNGSLVYSTLISNGAPDNWNGTSGGQLLPMGSYSFILRSGDKTITGNVTLLR
jgi:hypothetical protein